MFANTSPQHVAGCQITHPHKPHPKKPPLTTQFHIDQRCTSHLSGGDSRLSQQQYGYHCPTLSPTDSKHLIPDDGVLEKAPYRLEVSEPPRNCPPSHLPNSSSQQTPPHLTPNSSPQLTSLSSFQASSHRTWAIFFHCWSSIKVRILSALYCLCPPFHRGHKRTPTRRGYQQ